MGCARGGTLVQMCLQVMSLMPYSGGNTCARLHLCMNGFSLSLRSASGTVKQRSCIYLRGSRLQICGPVSRLGRRWCHQTVAATLLLSCYWQLALHHFTVSKLSQLPAPGAYQLETAVDMCLLMKHA
jgi:hypothetical protein